MKINYKKFSISILVCLFAGIIGSFFTASSIPNWYSILNKPFFNPPNYIFGPVWTTLYILMGISLYLVWNNKNKKSKNIKSFYKFFAIQLILNALWSLLFFGLKSPLLGFIEIIFLWLFILLSIISSYRISKIASYLLIPYILWVSFATVLNLYILLLN